MKKFLSILTFILCLPSLIFASPVLLNDNDDIPTVPPSIIIIIIKTPPPVPGQPRSLVQAPIECQYNPYMNGICATFNQDLGELDVLVENLSTGEYLEGTVDSAEGYVVLPVSSTAGVYNISFVTASGVEYTGEFEL